MRKKEKSRKIKIGLYVFFAVLFLCIFGIAYCQASPQSPSSTSSPSGSSTTITFVNPLIFQSVEGVVGSLLASLQGVIVTLAIVFIVVGAIFYLTSAGNESRVKAAKLTITAAMIGLTIGIASPSILKELYIILKGGEAYNCNIDPNLSQAELTAKIEECCNNKPGYSDADKEACKNTLSTYYFAPPIIDILLRTLNFLLSIFGTLAIIVLVLGGLMYLTAGGDEKKIDTGKKIVKYALFGIVICLAALIIVKQIAKFFVP